MNSFAQNPHLELPNHLNVVNGRKEIGEWISEFINRVKSIRVDLQRTSNLSLAKERFNRLGRLIQDFLAKNISETDARHFYDNAHLLHINGTTYSVERFDELFLSRALSYLEVLNDSIEEEDDDDDLYFMRT